MPSVCCPQNGHRASCGMKFWVDAQLPPQLASWLSAEFGVETSSLRDLGLRDATDQEIFQQRGRKGVWFAGRRPGNRRNLLSTIGDAPVSVFPGLRRSSRVASAVSSTLIPAFPLNQGKRGRFPPSGGQGLYRALVALTKNPQLCSGSFNLLRHYNSATL